MKKLKLLLLIVVGFVGNVLAQNRTISGKVTDKDGKSLPGATVNFKNTNSSTRTDSLGNFQIAMPGKGKPVLLVTFVGYLNTEIFVGKGNSFTIQLNQDAQTLGDVVVVGYANGIALTPDQTQLYVTESASHWVWIYNIMPNGTLTNKQRYGWLHMPDSQDNAWPDGLRCDRQGNIYVATRMGIQVLDQVGRVNVILPLPSGQPSNCCFGGADFRTLYVTCGDKVYRRKLKIPGANAFDNPFKIANPKL